MTKRLLRCLMVALGLGGCFAPRLARADIGDSFLLAQVRSYTPNCSAHPDFRVVGRASGIIGGSPALGVSFVGCFPTEQACRAWLWKASSAINGRWILHECDRR